MSSAYSTQPLTQQQEALKSTRYRADKNGDTGNTERCHDATINFSYRWPQIILFDAAVATVKKVF